MSSRLLTMKFMQRAAASRPASTAPAPDTASADGPSTPQPPPSKRQRLSNGTAHASPHQTPPGNQPRRTRESSQERIVREALEVEEAKRDAALERLAREKGETRWALSTALPAPTAQSDGTGTGAAFRIVRLGELDREGSDSEAEQQQEQGRRTFGKPVRTAGRAGKEEVEMDERDSADEDSQGESSEEYEPEDVDAMISRGRSEAADRARRELGEKRRGRESEGSRLAKERRGREVNLNSPRGRGGGISSGGGGSRAGGKRKSY